MTSTVSIVMPELTAASLEGFIISSTIEEIAIRSSKALAEHGIDLGL